MFRKYINNAVDSKINQILPSCSEGWCASVGSLQFVLFQHVFEIVELKMGFRTGLSKNYNRYNTGPDVLEAIREQKALSDATIKETQGECVVM